MAIFFDTGGPPGTDTVHQRQEKIVKEVLAKGIFGGINKY
jgi:hypothetical protein